MNIERSVVMSGKKCNSCGWLIKPEDDIYCSGCGKALRAMWLYSKRGKAAEEPLSCSYGDCERDCNEKRHEDCSFSPIDVSLDRVYYTELAGGNFSIVVKNIGESELNLVIDDKTQGSNYVMLSKTQNFIPGFNNRNLNSGEKLEISFDVKRSDEITGEIYGIFEIYDRNFLKERYRLKLSVKRESEISIVGTSIESKELNIFLPERHTITFVNTGDDEIQIDPSKNLFLYGNKGGTNKFSDFFIFDESVITLSPCSKINVGFKNDINSLREKVKIALEGKNTSKWDLSSFNLKLLYGTKESRPLPISLNFYYPAELSEIPGIKTDLTDARPVDLDFELSNSGLEDLEIFSIEPVFQESSIYDFHENFNNLGIRERSFYITEIILAVLLMHLDGQPTSDEKIVLLKYFEDKELIKEAINTIKNEKNYRYYSVAAYEKFKDDINFLYSIIKFLFKIAISDGIIPEEVEFIRNVAKDFQIEDKEFEEIKKIVIKKDELTGKISQHIKCKLSEVKLISGIGTSESKKVITPFNKDTFPIRLIKHHSNDEKRLINASFELSGINVNIDKIISAIIVITSNSQKSPDTLLPNKTKVKIDIKLKKATDYSNHVAIDFGTSNSCVSYATDENDIKTLNFTDETDSKMDELLRSIVFYPSSEETPVVGNKAFRMMKVKPTLTVRSMKTFLGKNQMFELTDSERGNFFQVSSRDVITVFMKYIIDETQKIVGQNIKFLTLSIPVDFISTQKDEMTRILSDYKIEWVPEPIAYICNYLNENKVEIQEALLKDKEVYILNIDYGGGTIDLALVKFYYDKDKDIATEIIAYDGREKFGGDALDRSIRNHLIRRIEESGDRLIGNEDTLEKEISYLNHAKEDKDKLRKNLIYLLDAAENVKIAFSSEPSKQVKSFGSTVDFDMKTKNVTVSLPLYTLKSDNNRKEIKIMIKLAEYEIILKNKLKEIKNLVDNVIEVAKTAEGKTISLQSILLSGQTCKSKNIVNYFKSEFTSYANGKNMDDFIVFDNKFCKTGIARGAAYYSTKKNLTVEKIGKSLKYSYGYREDDGLFSFFKHYAKRNTDINKEFEFNYKLPKNKMEFKIEIYINRGPDLEKINIESGRIENEKKGMIYIGSVLGEKIPEDFYEKNQNNRYIALIISKIDENENLRFFIKHSLDEGKRKELKFLPKAPDPVKIGDVY